DANCISNARQIGGYFQYYIEDNQGYYPNSSTGNIYSGVGGGNASYEPIWNNVLAVLYVSKDPRTVWNMRLFNCPSRFRRLQTPGGANGDTGRIAYGYNRRGLGNVGTSPTKANQIKKPSRIIVVADAMRWSTGSLGSGMMTDWFEPSYLLDDSISPTATVSSSNQYAPDFVHSGTANVLYGDGHVAKGRGERAFPNKSYAEGADFAQATAFSPNPWTKTGDKR
ncbi:MAG: H-X9-DG-CTERM domain-containing protein, partial [Victivallaceae bacterium]